MSVLDLKEMFDSMPDTTDEVMKFLHEGERKERHVHPKLCSHDHNSRLQLWLVHIPRPRSFFIFALLQIFPSPQHTAHFPACYSVPELHYFAKSAGPQQVEADQYCEITKHMGSCIKQIGCLFLPNIQQFESLRMDACQENYPARDKRGVLAATHNQSAEKPWNCYQYLKDRHFHSCKQTLPELFSTINLFSFLISRPWNVLQSIRLLFIS